MTDRDRFQMVIDRMEDIDADTLADAAQVAEQDGYFFTRFANLAKQELRRRMVAVQVTELPTAAVLVKIDTPSRDYQWDYAALEEKVKPLLLPGEWEECVAEVPPPPPKTYFKADTRKLNGLAEKRKGELGEAIANARFVAETPGPVRLTRIAEVPA